MVLETLAAVGLAGNIFQFIDFTGKLFNTAVKIYQSQDGATREAESDEDIAWSLQQSCEKLNAGINSIQENKLATQTTRTSLVTLATNCKAAAEEMIVALEALKSKKPGSKWKSLKAALATAWKESDLEAMRRKLDTYRSQLVLELQILQGGAWKDVMDRLEDGNKNIARQMGTHFVETISEIKVAQQQLKLQFEATVSQKVTTPVVPEKPEVIQAAMSQSPEFVPMVQKEAIDLCSDKAVLSSLRFDQMRFRHSKIPQAHQNTFSWMYSKCFEPWLESSEKVYWISGKPGSGKSTLVKYLVDNDQTPISLRQWAGPDTRLVITSYFFWVNGSELQRSQEGLLRTLLFEILQEFPALIKLVAPEAWNDVQTAMIGRSADVEIVWSQRALLAAFERLSKMGQVATAFCMFIDGLDEYRGDQDDLIKTISFLECLNVKLCIASRPWNIFKDAYGNKPHCQLRLEDLNKKDIQRYVQDHLGTRHDFQNLRDMDHQANEILDEIVEKSQGVFLWVHLVVRSLVDGLRNADRMSQLHERLHSLPADLEDFYRHIFLSLDPFYRKQLAQMFQVTLARSDPLSPLAYWYLDEQEDDPSVALEMPCHLLSTQQIYVKMLEVQKRINGRSKGMLEITPPIVEGSSQSRVDFLHRTVQDFLMTTDMQEILKSHQAKDFDADLAICGALLAEFKAANIGLFGHENIFHCFFKAAKSMEATKKRSPVAYLDELEQAYEKSNPGRQWSHLKCQSFTSTAVAYDLHLFMESKGPNHASLENIYSWLRASLNRQGVKPRMLKAILSSDTWIEKQSGRLWKLFLHTLASRETERDGIS
ncbi:hypothetical protein DPSP01_007027 [Paraphaeosphaeria sporulosa]